MSDNSCTEELTELARVSAWGLAKGGDLDARHAGKVALAQRLDILEAAERAGIFINLTEHGIGRIYTRAEVDALP